MKTIGLLGGMSWESTAVYYRLINEQTRQLRGGLTSASILMQSFDFSQIVALQKADDWHEAARILGDAGRNLANAGADCLLICTNTMHLIAREVEQRAGIPLVDIIVETAGTLRRHDHKRPLLLGTRYTMEHGFYAQRMMALGLDVVVPPDPSDRDLVHAVIFDELCQGVVGDQSRDMFNAIIAKAKKAGADSVILGCTEIGLLLNQNEMALPGFDSTTIHARAAVHFALGQEHTNMVA